MKEHYALATVSKEDLVNIFEVTKSEAKLVHRYRKQLPVIIDAGEDEGFCIDMRELHKQLRVKARFNDWAKRRLQKVFFDGDDFYSHLSKSDIGRPTTEYMLTVDTAKQISMMEGGEVGKLVRKYFILCEKLILRMAKRNPIRQSCKNSTKNLFINISGRVPQGKHGKVMAEMLSRDTNQTKKLIKSQLERSFGESEIYFDYLKKSGVKEF